MFRGLASLAVMAGMAAPASAGIGPAETVVLVNAKSPDGRRVAAHYVKARQIPSQQVCEVSCEPALEIPMDDFVRDVVDPLRRFLREREMETRCTAVVITQGMPILARTPGGAVSTAAAISLLDTEMCGQPQTRFPSVRNPYTSGAAPVAPVVGSARFLLVTALLSTTADEAIGLVDRSVASDGTAPAGARFVFQDADGAAGVRNAGYDQARRELEGAGFATEHVAQERKDAPVVTGRKAVMGYMSGGSYSHLTPEGVKTNEYLPGAICDMLQSFGAVPQNFMPEQKGSQFPVTHMVRAGITGVHGAVAEPYNIAFPDVRLFAPYVEGFTLAETFHQRMPLSYWMNLTLGDPLCAPYAQRIVPTAHVGPTGEDGVRTFDVEAKGAVRIDLYVDGRFAGSVEGEKGTIRADPAIFPQTGRFELLAEATGPGAAEPRGWSVARVAETVRPAPRPVASGPRVTFERLLAEAPTTIAAGEVFEVRATAADAGGARAEGWKGRLELRSAKPPVRWARVDSPVPGVAMQCRFTKAGEVELTVTAPDDGREAKLKVRVTPGPFHHATCPASSFPLGQECDLDVRLEDEFGNALETYDGTIELSVPDDAAARVPPAIGMKSGRGTFRSVVLTRPGDARIVLRDGKGTTVSQAGEHVSVAKSAIRAWLVAGPAPAKTLFAADPAASAKDEGSLVAKLPLRRRTDQEAVPLPAGSAKGTDAAVLVTWIEAAAATKARLLGAAPGRVRILLDGREVFDGTPKAADGKGKREPLADVSLGAGVHRLTVVAETRAAAPVSFEIDDGAGKFPAGVVIRARAASGDAK